MMMGRRRLCFVIIVTCFAYVSGSVWAKDRLICCGADEVFIIELEEDAVEASAPVWSWKAEDSAEIPEAGRRSFASTDECKPVGEFLLITSSSGGVALVRRSDKRCVFYTQARNAHSACLLPDYRVAVASSFGGDELLIYELTRPSGSPAEPIAKIALRGAHGAVWDPNLKRLWALGSDELLLVDVGVKPTASKLKVEKRIELPSAGGHDLWQSREPSTLFVTTNEHVYRFNKKDERFTLHRVLADQLKVKSVCDHPQTGEIVYHMGTKDTWWSDTIRFVGGRQEIQLPDRRLYKVRWDK